MAPNVEYVMNLSETMSAYPKATTTDDLPQIVSDSSCSESSFSSGDGSFTDGADSPQSKATNRRRRGRGKRGSPVKEGKHFSPEEMSRYVAMDCEMVGTGFDGRFSSVARVTLIDWYGVVLMDEVVRQDREVTDYRTFVSGITPEILEQARIDLPTCRSLVLQILKGKILVGHGLKNDLRALGITHPWYNVRDTAKYEPFMKVRFSDGVLWPRGLKELVKEKLGRDIQVGGRPHCPYQDAFAALCLYRLVRTKWERAMSYKFKKTRKIQEMQS